MKIANSIYSGFLKKGVTGISDFLVMLDNGTLLPIEYISEDSFTESFGITKDQYYDLIAEKVIGEEIYGV